MIYYIILYYTCSLPNTKLAMQVFLLYKSANRYISLFACIKLYFCFNLSSGIIVPGYVKNKSDLYDASNLLLMEATAGEGIVVRPLLTRMEMSESRSVVLLPLALPGEKRNDQFYEATSNVLVTEQIVNKKLEEFRDSWIELSKTMNYSKAHSTLGLVGAIAYALGYHTNNPGPTSPSAWLVTKALADAKVAQNITERTIKESKVEDYLRDYRFQDQDVIRLRPGWRFLAPVSFREK